MRCRRTSKSMSGAGYLLPYNSVVSLRVTGWVLEARCEGEGVPHVPAYANIVSWRATRSLSGGVGPAGTIRPFAAPITCMRPSAAAGLGHGAISPSRSSTQRTVHTGASSSPRRLPCVEIRKPRLRRNEVSGKLQRRVYEARSNKRTGGCAVHGIPYFSDKTGRNRPQFGHSGSLEAPNAPEFGQATRAGPFRYYHKKQPKPRWIAC
jgi:hypothetical protein